jgi:hypothetical protein
MNRKEECNIQFIRGAVGSAKLGESGSKGKRGEWFLEEKLLVSTQNEI